MSSIYGLPKTNYFPPCPKQNMMNCLNCENSFEGSYCNICGQKTATHRFSMHEWLHEIPHSIFHIDSGFFQTLKTLLARPGNAIREYLEGKRKLLFSPFLYVLIWCGVYVVISHFFDKPEVAAEHIEFGSLMESFSYIESHYYKIIVVAMILPTTFGSFLAYYRSGYNFAENLVLNTYLIGQLVIADIIIVSAFDDDRRQTLYSLFQAHRISFEISVLVLDVLAVFQTEKMVLGNFAVYRFADRQRYCIIRIDVRGGVYFIQIKRRALNFPAFNRVERDFAESIDEEIKICKAFVAGKSFDKTEINLLADDGDFECAESVIKIQIG